MCCSSTSPLQADEQARRSSCTHTEDEELAPVASDLMLRLSETNSILKARESEVASLQAQNALLRQQVEQQQQQLDDFMGRGRAEWCDGSGEEYQ